MSKAHSRKIFILLLATAAVPASASNDRNFNVCGDSAPGYSEECDDGNALSGDGCSSTCEIESGFDCTAAIAGTPDTMNILPDGSFENGNVGGEWTVNHSIFGPDLICGQSCFSMPGAAGPKGQTIHANYVLLAGGSFSQNSTGTAEHIPVAIPADATTLEFQWATLASGPAGDPCAGPTDGITVFIDGNEVFATTDAGPCLNVNPYERIVIDLATAPGGPYQEKTVGFEFLGSATGIPPNEDLTNIFLDDVSINVPVESDPPTPSVCTAIVCGDAVLGSTESCDDGNALSGDGCSASCELEEDFVCDLPVVASPSGDDVVDGGLEGGIANAAWQQTGTEFAPICSQLLCGFGLAAEGAFYAWFGRADVPQSQTLSQDLVISKTSSELRFELLTGVCDSPADALTVEIDGTEVYRHDCTAITTAYVTQTVPLGAFADGGVHTLTFASNTVAANGGPSNFFVDGIAIANDVPVDSAPGACTELGEACWPTETFDAGIPVGWTVLNVGPDPADGWVASGDFPCATQNWNADNANNTDNNVTGGRGQAVCADSDATGQLDIDFGFYPPNEMDTWLCSTPFDLTSVVDPALSARVVYQANDNFLNDNGTPGDETDDFDDDFLHVLAGTAPPSVQSIADYDLLADVSDHLDSDLALSPASLLTLPLDTYNAEATLYVCFRYRGTYAWYAQVDNVAVRGSACMIVEGDGDGVPDAVDNCIVHPNADQRDTDGDGHGNRCDADLNQDCLVNAVDLGIFKTVFFTANADADFDGSGFVNPIDLGILKSLFFGAPGPSADGALCNP